MRHSRTLISSAVVLGVCSGAVAGPVTVTVTGTAINGFGSGIIAGVTPLSASFTYNPPGSPTSSGPTLSIFATATLNHWTVGTFEYASTAGQQVVSANNVGNDGYESVFNAVSGPSQNSQSPTQFVFRTLVSAGVLSGHTALPSVAELNQFTTPSIFMEFGISNFVDFSVTSVQVSDNPVIPLPSGAAMAMVGMGVIGVRRRRS